MGNLRKLILFAATSLAMMSCAGNEASNSAGEPDDPLTRLLSDAGAGVDTAPTEAQALDDSVLCNSSNDLAALLNTTADEELCFRNAPESSQGAVLVVAFSTDEGDPIIKVQRALASTETIQVFEDSTQDSFGAGGWRSYECAANQLSRQTTELGNATFSILTC